MNNRKAPRIRFKGYTDDWEQRKLGEIGKARSGVGFPDAEQGGRTGVPFFKVSDMNLDVNENEMTISNNYVTAEQIANHRWSPITELPAIFFAKVGAAVLLNRKRLCRFPFLLDNNTMSYSLSPTKWDADFAKALFGTVDLTSLVQVGALPSYNAGDVESMEKYLPSLLEQEQIGVFFKHLDHLITLHQRKLEKLKIVKKAMLENCFPKNGEKVPRFRFSGFTGDWEQRKFSDLVKTRRGLTYKPADIREIGVRVLRSSNIDEDCFVRRSDDIFVDVNAINIDFAKENDILITAANGSSRLVGKHTILSAIPDKSTVHGGFMLLGTSEEAYFANALMSSIWYKKFIDLYVSGGNGAIGNLNKRDLDEQDIFIPTKKEQQVIGNYFANLDHLITLHQRKLEKLKIIKKSFLEKMFV